MKIFFGLNFGLGAIAIVLGIIRNDSECLGAGFGMLIVMGLLYAAVKGCTSYYESKGNLRYRNKNPQDDYDNYWGIIDWHDK